jgi:hypothetical protein
MCESTTTEEKKYWIKFWFYSRDTGIHTHNLKFKNVSSDFIKGIYIILLKQIPKYEQLYKNTLDALDYYMSVKSNYVLNDCLKPNIVDWWADGNYFEYNFSASNGHNFYEGIHRSIILNDPARYNEEWKKYIENETTHLSLTKRYSAFIQIEEIDYIVQFDSIDFLNGFEMMRFWIENNYSDSLDCLSLRSIFDSGKVCKKYVEYDIKENTQIQSDILYIIDCLIVFFPKVLAEMIVYQHILTRECCNYHCAHYYEYDVCSTLCIGDTCHMHDSWLKSKCMLSLKECLVKITLEQL